MQTSCRRKCGMATHASAGVVRELPLGSRHVTTQYMEPPNCSVYCIIVGMCTDQMLYTQHIPPTIYRSPVPMSF
jgi:hypothetical protein